MPMNRIIAKEEIPDWLNIAIGYSTNGMLGSLRIWTLTTVLPFRALPTVHAFVECWTGQKKPTQNSLNTL